MLDPLGGVDRIREFFISYLDTAFRIRDERVADMRRALLREQGTLAASIQVDPEPRYRPAVGTLESLIQEFPGNPLGELSRAARLAFVELALSGLFPGKRTTGSDLSRTW